jgi:hypothetical protein
LTSPRELQQRSRAADESIEYPIGRIEVMVCQKVVKPAQIGLSRA